MFKYSSTEILSPDIVYEFECALIYNITFFRTVDFVIFRNEFYPSMQIRLWESDLNRVEMTPAHFYDEFPSRVSKASYFGCQFANACLDSHITSHHPSGRLRGCLWLCSRVEWFTMGGFEENAHGSKGRDSHANERVSSRTKVGGQVSICELIRRVYALENFSLILLPNMRKCISKKEKKRKRLTQTLYTLFFFVFPKEQNNLKSFYLFYSNLIPNVDKVLPTSSLVYHSKSSSLRMK